MRAAWALALVPLGMTACNDKDEDTGDGWESDIDIDTDADSDTDTDTDSDADFTPLEPEEGVATDITVEIYSDGWGDLLETRTLKTEGSVTCDTPEKSPYYDPPQFYFYATADGYWTELYECTYGDTVDVDLDAVPDAEQAIAGSVFEMQYYFVDWEFAGEEMLLQLDDGTTTTVTTDSQGRFGLSGLPEGDVDIAIECEKETFTFTIANSAAGTDYEDLFFYSPIQAGAPIVYLWPEETTDVDVLIDFPNGGQVTISDPPYEDGWHVTADPDGTIDGAYPYLFYEGNIPLTVQDEQGWVLDGGDLEAELGALLVELGFEGREIDDFLDWWLDELEGPPYLAVYPQEPEEYTVLDVTPTPDAELRAMLMVRPVYYPMTLPEPELALVPERDGFVVVEWGVLLGI